MRTEAIVREREGEKEKNEQEKSLISVCVRTQLACGILNGGIPGVEIRVTHFLFH